MLTLEGVTRLYGDKRALDGVSLEVRRGEVVGLLGVNGAGKTTALRIVAGLLPPTLGRATVDGHDCCSASVEARRRLGYLAEGAPLYRDLRVEGFLRFRAALKRVPWRGRKAEVARVMKRLALEEHRTAPIGVLSQGLRQRVGLADALLGSPKLILLDEPTASLDPAQTAEVRALLRELRDDHAVLLSTHALADVEAAATRVVVLHEGKVAADTALAALADAHRSVLRVELVGPGEEAERLFRGLDGAKSVTRQDLGGGAHRFTIEAQPGKDLREAIGRGALLGGHVLRELAPAGGGLEALFLAVTQPRSAAPGGAPGAPEQAALPEKAA